MQKLSYIYHVTISRILSLFFASLVFMACSTKPDSAFTCTPEQLSRLNPEAAILTPPDTSDIVTIDVNSILENDEFDFQNIVSDIHFIPLQTTPDAQIGRVDRMIITNSNIYISDQHALYIFSLSGEFVNKIPFFFTCPHDFAFDADLSELVVCADNHVAHYTSEGNHLWSERFPVRFNSIAVEGSSLIVHCDSVDLNSHLSLSAAASPCLFINRQGGLFKYLPALEGHTPSQRGTRRLQPFDGGVAMVHSFCDTLYYINGGDVHARYVLDYSERRLPNPSIEQGDNDFFAGKYGKRFYYFGGDFIPSKNGFFLSLRTERAMTIRAFYDARTGKLVGGIQPMADYCQMPPIYNPLTSFSDCYAALFHPYQTENGHTFRFVGPTVSEAEKDRLEGVRHEDNPVVALFRVNVD